MKNVEIFGTGCKKCIKLEENCIEAKKNINSDCTIKHIYDLEEISNRGVFQTPALMIDGKIIVSGKVLKVKKLEELLK